MKLNKEVIILSMIFIAIVVFFILFSNNPKITGESSNSQQIQIHPLSEQEINIVGQTILSNEFIGDLPKKGVIALQFYNFENNQRIWQSGFLIDKDGFLSSGEPDMVLIMHSKYIPQLKEDNLCEIIQTAQTNNDMWVETEQSNSKLLLKYASMLKYRNCFGF